MYVVFNINIITVHTRATDIVTCFYLLLLHVALLNLSTTVSHWELQNWPMLTGGLCSERQKLPDFHGTSLCTGLTVCTFSFVLVQDISYIQTDISCV